eukprot:1347729-Amphidinium_carterae.1
MSWKHSPGAKRDSSGPSMTDDLLSREDLSVAELAWALGLMDWEHVRVRHCVAATSLRDRCRSVFLPRRGMPFASCDKALR